MSDPAAALARSLKASASAAGVAITITDTAARPWCSATFVGKRCRMTLDAKGERLTEWLDALPEADLPMRGYYLADLAVLSLVDGEVMLGALVLEDR